jgi:GTP-binding protein Era
MTQENPLTESTQTPPDHRSGVVAVIGRPNVGKSTLLNRLLGQKIAITSPKPQTTRDQLLGILTEDDMQILFLDTPGIHQPQHKLGEYMVRVAQETIQDADVVLWLVDANTPPKQEEQQIAELLHALQSKKKLPPLIIGLNKVDHEVGAKRHQWPDSAGNTELRAQEYAALLPWLDDPISPVTLPLSGLTGQSIDQLLAMLRQRLPPGPRYYPEDQVTDLQMRFIAAELIREKALMLLQQEVPHSIAVEVDEFSQRDDTMTYISAVIYVERASQKGIVLGQKGSMIKKIGQAARPEIEELVGTKVYLELWVKVWEKWRTREGMLRQLGYAVQR